VPSVIGDLAKTVRAIMAAPGENLDCPVGDVELDAVTVEIDLVDLPLTSRHRLDLGRQCRLDEARVGALMPSAAGFRRRNATQKLHVTYTQDESFFINSRARAWVRFGDRLSPLRISCTNARYFDGFGNSVC
jgi:hypothetical protein